jgi:sugar (pentulose or hexulose) kinase
MCGRPLAAGTAATLLLIMYGSTMFLIQVLADYFVHPALWTTVGTEPETLLLAAGTATAGSLTNWLRDLMGHVLDLFDESATHVTRTVAVGGGVNSPLWTSIMSDVTGCTQLIPRQTIGACYGGALLAAIGIGAVEPKTDWTVIDHKIEPDPIRRASYDELYQLWRELYPATRDQMHRLGAWAIR